MPLLRELSGAGIDFPITMSRLRALTGLSGQVFNKATARC